LTKRTQFMWCSGNW